MPFDSTRPCRAPSGILRRQTRRGKTALDEPGRLLHDAVVNHETDLETLGEKEPAPSTARRTNVVQLIRVLATVVSAVALVVIALELGRIATYEKRSDCVQRAWARVNLEFGSHSPESQQKTDPLIARCHGIATR